MVTIEDLKQDLEKMIDEMAFDGVPHSKIREGIVGTIGVAYEIAVQLFVPKMKSPVEMLRLVEVLLDTLTQLNEYLVTRDFSPVTIQELNNSLIVTLEELFNDDIENVVEFLRMKLLP